MPFEQAILITFIVFGIILIFVLVGLGGIYYAAKIYIRIKKL